jgi:hypothetical protein
MENEPAMTPKTQQAQIAFRSIAVAVLLLIGCAVDAGTTASNGPPIGLTGGASSVDALMDQFLDALARQDEVAMLRLRVDKAEYTRIIMPGQIQKGQSPPPADEKVCDFAWSLLDTKSRYYTQALMKEFGGRTNVRKAVRFTKQPVEYAWYRAMGEVRMMVEDPEDKRQYELSTGWVAEVDGKYKFIGFNADD